MTSEERQKLALKRGDKYYHHGCGEMRETLKVINNNNVLFNERKKPIAPTNN